jgi:asparagine synthase (glutamine-hydrolysing)
MCGIAGIVSSDPQAINLPSLKRMTDAIAHRGPDGEGFWISGDQRVGLGHRRLKVIDLSEDGKQPMTYGIEGRYVIVYNGEIYNYIELRQQLTDRGYQFRSQTDTEVILALYDYKKEACLQDLNGMFAFALYDLVAQTLFCARDRFGEKPFYYAFKEGAQFIFASEMKGLWAYGQPRRPNGYMLYNYLSHGLFQNVRDPSETFFEGVYSLEPGHYLTIGLQNCTRTKVRYWELPLRPEPPGNAADWASQFRSLMEKSVKLRLRADVKVGTSLSGGLDSTLIIHLIRQCLGEDHPSISAFSARFPGWDLDEGEYMALAASHAHARVFESFPSGVLCWEQLPEVFRHQEEPFGSAGIYAQYCLMKSASDEGVTVLLDGQGADELLGGYPHYYVRGVRYFLSRYLPSADRQIRKVVSTRGLLLDPGFMADYGGKNYLPGPESAYRFSNLKGWLRYDLLSGSLPTLLRYSDRNAMAFGREVRLPFLDLALVQFVLSLPDKELYGDGWTKLLMRQAYDKVLPDRILKRKDKVGFEPPQRLWMTEPRARELFQAGLQKLVSEGILSKSALNKPLEASDAYLKGNGSWRLLMASMLFLA